jgi:cold shock CspA family protein
LYAAAGDLFFSGQFDQYAKGRRRIRPISGRFGSPLSLRSFTKPGCATLAHARHAWEKDPHMITGTVKFFNADKGHGFIAPEAGGGDAFVHISAVERAGMRTLDKDQRALTSSRRMLAARPRLSTSSRPNPQWGAVPNGMAPFL